MKKWCFQHLLAHVAKNATKYLFFWYLCVGHRNMLVAQGFGGKRAAECQNKWAHFNSCVGCRTFQALRRRVQSKRSNFWPQWNFAWLRKICKAGYTGLPECCWHFWNVCNSSKLRSMRRDPETYSGARKLLAYWRPHWVTEWATRREYYIAGLPTGNRLTAWFSEVSANCPQVSATVRGQKTYSPRCPRRPCPRRI